MMKPDDFEILKNELQIRPGSDEEPLINGLHTLGLNALAAGPTVVRRDLQACSFAMCQVAAPAMSD